MRHGKGFGKSIYRLRKAAGLFGKICALSAETSGKALPGLARAMVVAVSAVLIFAPMEARAGEARINFTDETKKAGDIVKVFMKIRSEDGAGISDARIILSYPKEKLEFISGTDCIASGEDSDGIGYILVSGVSFGAGTDIAEYHLAFRALSPGAAEILVTEEEIYGRDGDPAVLTHIGSSAITIEAPPEPDGTDTDPTPSGTDETEGSLDTAEGSGSAAASPAPTEAGNAAGPLLSSADTVVTVLIDPADTEAPGGLRKGSALIDNQMVTAWYREGMEDEYAVFSGMNEEGEASFYIYDLSESEKTVQRYFPTPSENEAGSSSVSEGSDQTSASSGKALSNAHTAVLCVVLTAISVGLSFIDLSLKKRLDAFSKAASDDLSTKVPSSTEDRSSRSASER